jgi:hypothetical protein
MKSTKILNLIKEPIVQFFMLGVLLFGLDHLLVLNREDPRTVLVDDRQLSEFIEIFEDGQGRSPSGREINNMVIAWAQNEILYREARRMGLDRGDDMIRNRLILKIRNVLFNNVVLDYPSEAELEQFFEFNQAAYHIAERYDLELIVLPANIGLELARELQQRALADEMPDAIPGNKIQYQNRNLDNLVAMFGLQQSARLLANEADAINWSLISNEQGHHLVRITAKHAPVSPTLDSVRSRVIRDWERYSGDLQIANQTYNIARQYRVHLDLSDAFLDQMDSDLPKNPFDESSVSNDTSLGAQNTSTGTLVDGR